MKRCTVLNFFTCIFLFGCAAPAQQGLNFMNSGNYQAAYNVFSQCAANGDPYCINNIGVMYQRGQMQGGVNITEAVKYYTLAARHGIPIAQQNLRALGRPVPPADLQAAYQYQQAQEQQAAAALGHSIGCALGGGCGSQPSSYNAPHNTAPQTIYGSSTNFSQLSNTGSDVLVEKQCTSDFACGVGFKCVKAQFQSQGVCMKTVNEFGNQQFNMPENNSVMPNMDLEGECRFSTDCPIGFRCDQEYKVCVK